MPPDPTRCLRLRRSRDALRCREKFHLWCYHNFVRFATFKNYWKPWKLGMRNWTESVIFQLQIGSFKSRPIVPGQLVSRPLHGRVNSKSKCFLRTNGSSNNTIFVKWVAVVLLFLTMTTKLKDTRIRTWSSEFVITCVQDISRIYSCAGLPLHLTNQFCLSFIFRYFLCWPQAYY